MLNKALRVRCSEMMKWWQPEWTFVDAANIDTTGWNSLRKGGELSNFNLIIKKKKVSISLGRKMDISHIHDSGDDTH